MKTSTLRHNTTRQLVWAIALLLGYCQPALARKSFMSEGFGSRSWYVPANIKAGAGKNRASIIKSHLYIWNRPNNTGVIIPILGKAGALPLAGTVDCGATAIVGDLVAGIPSTVMLKVTANVSTTGTSSFTVSGSGLTPLLSPYTFASSNTGLQTFYLVMSYDGSALGATTFTFNGLGSCTADLSVLTPRPAMTSLTPLVNCTPITAVVLSK